MVLPPFVVKCNCSDGYWYGDTCDLLKDCPNQAWLPEDTTEEILLMPEYVLPRVLSEASLKRYLEPKVRLDPKQMAGMLHIIRWRLCGGS